MYLRASPAFAAARDAFLSESLVNGDGSADPRLPQQFEYQGVQRAVDRLRLRQRAASCGTGRGTRDDAVNTIYKLCTVWGEGGVGGTLTKSRGRDRRSTTRRVVIQRVETLTMNSIKVSLGDGTVITGDFVVANSIKDSFQRAKASAAPDELKMTLQQLVSEVGKLASHLDPEAAAMAADDLETLTKEASRPKPRKETWQLSVKGLRDAATAVKEIGRPVLDVVEKLMPLLLAAS